jgi:hypothetical protein
MRNVSAALAAAIEATERAVRVRVSVDWDADGHGPAGSVDDISTRAAQVQVSSVLQGTLPEQANVVEGTGAATATVDLAKGSTDNERVDAVRYFSPTANSTATPLAGKERLGRNVEVDAEFFTDLGWQRVALLRGTTRRVAARVAERAAQLEAVDYRTRLRTLVTLPAVAADVPFNAVQAASKPGLEGSWVVSFVLWRCGFPLSPTPPDGCRLWAPFHGSAMPFVCKPFLGSPPSYTTYQYQSMATSIGPMEFDVGPFFLASRGPKLGPWTFDSANFDFYPADDGPPLVDGNGRSNGRVTAWVKTTAQALAFNMTNNVRGADGMSWSVTTGQLDIRNGGTTRTVNGPVVPFDGAWHLVGVQWDDVVGRADFNIDGAVTTQAFTPTPAAPGAVDDYFVFCDSTAPVAELQLSAGLAFSEPWPPLAYDPPATVDRSALRLDGIVAAPAAQGWQILTELAAAEQGAVYLDADGRPHYSTRGHLVQPAAQIVQRTVDAATDMFDLALDVDLARVANVVSCGYQPVVVAVQVPAWSLAETVVIQPSHSAVLLVTTSGLVTTQREVVGHVNTIYNGTGVSTPIGTGFAGPYPVTVDYLSDTTAIITITNSSSVIAYVVDTDGQPDLVLKADTISQGGSGGDEVVFVDLGSVAKYEAQPMSLPVNRWVQNRSMAGGLAMASLGDLAAPQPVFAEVPIPGDPRLQPYDRLRLVDPDNTELALDVWYVGGTHTFDPAGYEQTLACRPARNRYLAGVSGEGVDLVG